MVCICPKRDAEFPDSDSLMDHLNAIHIGEIIDEWFDEHCEEDPEDEPV